MIILSLQMKAFALSTAAKVISILLAATSVAPLTTTQTSPTAEALPPGVQTSPSRGLITETSVGSVRLGMTVANARKALPGFTLSRTTDGEGLALIAVKLSGNALMTLYAGEANPNSPINERAVIEFVEVSDAGYRTAAGVHPRMPLGQVKQKYGKLEEIKLTEIESREYATFANQPAGIQLRVMSEDGIAGVYPDGQSRTTRYAPSAYIYSISIKGARTKRPQFSSEYTDLKTQCKNSLPQSDEGRHTSLFCKGYGNYRIHIFDSATALHINAQTLEGKASIPLATQGLTYDQGRKIEWRLADGKPFAVILRVFKYNGKGQYPLQEKPTGEVLLVKGLAGYEHIDGEVDVTSNANPNVKARTLADSGYVNQRIPKSHEPKSTKKPQ